MMSRITARCATLVGLGPPLPCGQTVRAALLVACVVFMGSELSAQSIVALTPIDAAEQLGTLLGAEFGGIIDGSTMTNANLILLMNDGNQKAIWIDCALTTPAAIDALADVFAAAKAERVPIVFDNPDLDILVRVNGAASLPIAGPPGLEVTGSVVVSEVHRTRFGHRNHYFDSPSETVILPVICGTRVSPDVLFVRGDVNNDQAIDIADAVSALSHLFGGALVVCPSAVDANDDGTVNIADPISILSLLFNNAPPLPPPGPTPGGETTHDNLDCGPDTVLDEQQCDPLETATTYIDGPLALVEDLAAEVAQVLDNAFAFNTGLLGTVETTTTSSSTPDIAGRTCTLELGPATRNFKIHDSWEQKALMEFGVFVDVIYGKRESLSPRKYLRVYNQPSTFNPRYLGSPFACTGSSSGKKCWGFYSDGVLIKVVPSENPSLTRRESSPQTDTVDSTFESSIGMNFGAGTDAVSFGVDASQSTSQTIPEWRVTKNSSVETSKDVQWLFYQSRGLMFKNNGYLKDPPQVSQSDLSPNWEVLYELPCDYTGRVTFKVTFQYCLRRIRVSNCDAFGWFCYDNEQLVSNRAYAITFEVNMGIVTAPASQPCGPQPTP